MVFSSARCTHSHVLPPSGVNGAWARQCAKLGGTAWAEQAQVLDAVIALLAVEMHNVATVTSGMLQSVMVARFGHKAVGLLVWVNEHPFAMAANSSFCKSNTDLIGCHAANPSIAEAIAFKGRCM